MTRSDEEFHQWLLTTFRDEADEILTGISQGLIELEKAEFNSGSELLEQIFRKTHSLKGAARAVDLRDIESVCQNIESVFSLMKRGELIPDAEMFDLLHSSIAAIYAVLSGDKNAGLSTAEIVIELRNLATNFSSLQSSSDLLKPVSDNEPVYSPIPYADSLQDRPEGKDSEIDTGYSSITTAPVQRAEALPDGKDGSNYPGIVRNQHLVKDGGTVRIASHKLDRLISGSDDLLTTRLFITHRMRELEDMMSNFSIWRWNHSQIEGDLNKIQELTFGYQNPSIPSELLQPLERLVEYLKFDREFVSTLQHDLSFHIRATEVDRSALESSTNEISDLIHDAVLVPVSTILSSYSKFVRDYSRSAGKKIDLEIEGDEIEMDRRILEAIKTPLMHLIHNSIDHGIEYPDIRIERGKSEYGKLKIRVSAHSGSKLALEVIDDGSGIDPNLIRKAAVEKGVISGRQETNITDEEAIWLIFRSGLSTNSQVSDLSGRGLGLAIVDDMVTRLGGELRVSSEPLIGTSISIILPVRLATLRGVVVRLGNQTYVFPIQQVRMVIRVDSDSFYFQGNRMTARIGGEVVRVVRLSDILGVPDTTSQIGGMTPIPIVELEYAGRKIACMVDEVIRVQEIVVRPLGSLLRRVKRITGAVILGDGSVAMVLDPLEIIQESYATGQKSYDRPPVQRLDKHILVVDDSATSRALLRRTLEISGYQVYTAHDGMDAFGKLREHNFDMVVSDVDMPRMNGYVLTEKIRADERFNQIPVLLVTSLDSVQDREYGKMVGANAYIVKSKFEKNSFIKTINTLLYNYK